MRLCHLGPVVSQLERSHRLVIPDLPVLGESKPVARLDPATFDTWFAEHLRMTSAEKPTLVAHSLSGGLAAGFAIRYGDLLERLVIYGSPGMGPYRPHSDYNWRRSGSAFGRRSRNGERFDRWSFLDLDRTREPDPTWHHAFEAYCRSREALRHVKRAMGRLVKTQSKQLPDTELERIDVPTSLLWGRHDWAVPLRIGEYANNTFGWPLQVIDDAGHVPHSEQPAAFLRALSEFIPTPRCEAETL